MTRLLEADRPRPAFDAEQNASYRKALDKVMGDVDKLNRTAQDRTIDLLAELRAQVVATISDADAPSRAMYERTLGQIDEAIRRFIERYRTDVARLQTQGFNLGVALTQAPLAAGGVAVGAAGISDDLIDIATQFSADLIQGIGDELRKRINNELVGVLVGAQTPSDAVAKIGRNLTDPNHFRTIGARAQAIVVTEIGRVQALASQARQNELAAIVPGLRKRWVHARVGEARQAHLEADARYSFDGSIGPIPVGANFSINGHAARFPRDPSLPASETVHCRCQSVPVIVETEETAS